MTTIWKYRTKPAAWLAPVLALVLALSACAAPPPPPLVVDPYAGAPGGGAVYTGPVPAGSAPQHVIAFSLLQQFFGLFGATGKSLPALAVVGVLLAWHIARQDRWRVRWPTLGAMAIESSLLSVPLLALSVALAQILRVVPLADVDLAHARDEGEGDRTVAAWRQGHERFWHSPEVRGEIGDADFTVDDATPVVLERFRVVRRCPPA